MKKLLSIGVLVALGVGLIPALAGAAPNVLIGANADFDYVYMDEDTTSNETSEAAAKDSDPVNVFTDDDGDKQFLYMGSKSQFDQIYFQTVRTATYKNGDNDLDWEYYEDGNWRNLSVSDSYLDGFTNKGMFYVSFDIPNDWDKVTYQGDSAYWVRVSPENDVKRSATVEQISARTYNLELNIEDEDSDEVDDLVRNDFHVYDGTNNQILGYADRGDGEYWFSLAAEANDTSYKLTIDDDRYQSETISISTLSTTLKTYKVELDDKNDKPNTPEKPNTPNKPYHPSLPKGDYPFTDIDGFEWAEAAIEDLYLRGVISGRSYYSYAPSDEVTRAEFLKMIILSAELDVDDYDNEDEDFRDVASHDWFYEYVQAGLSLDLIDDDSYFNPNDAINRAEAVAILVRLEDRLNDVNLNSTYTSFWDVNPFDWFVEYVAYAYAEGVVEGYDDGYFLPDNNLNRAEAAVLADRAFDTWWN